MGHSLLILNLDLFRFGIPVYVAAFGNPRGTQRSEKLLQTPAFLNDKIWTNGLGDANVYAVIKCLTANLNDQMCIVLKWIRHI